MDPERRREQLLDVAALYVSEHGVDVSLDDIADAAGVSPPLMRHYFKNRDGLLVALMQCGIEETDAIWTNPTGGDLAARLARYLEWIELRPWAHRLWVAAPSKELALAPLVARARRRLMGVAIDRRYEDQDAEQRARANAWVAVIESTVHQWLDPGSADSESSRASRADLVTRLLDIAVRLDIPTARDAPAVAITA
jgi:AcrR family transcriptional regulator